MSLSCGFVGLPNVGKSTLFNAILKKCLAAAANYPFCTIEKNEGKVPVEDPRLEALAKIASSERIVQALLSCVDIAGLVKGASKGDGQGNKFLSHIMECDLIIQVLRCFEESDITHVSNSIDPMRDFHIINSELQLSDIDRLEKILLEKKTVSADIKNMAEIAKNCLYDNLNLRDKVWNEEFIRFFKLYNFLTFKPMLIAANCSSFDVGVHFEAIKNLNPIKVYASLEVMLQTEKKEDHQILLDEFGIKDSGLNNLIKAAYDKLDLITYFTVGKEEARAWKIPKGYNMQKAAGCIHSDFEKKFIAADVIDYNDFIKYSGWVNARQNGAVRLCSKTTIVEDGNICLFKTNA